MSGTRKIRMSRLYYQLLLLFGTFKKLFFLNQFTAGKNFKLYASGGVIGGIDKVKIGNNVILHGWLISDGGTIILGDNVTIHKNTIIRSMEKVEIGSHTDIGAQCFIQDHNSMSLDFKERRNKGGNVSHSPINIGSDVWIARNVTILKGVTVGDRAIVGTGAIVTKNVPKEYLAAGNPAQNLKHIKAN